jgi:hypothetical protein
MGLACGVSMIFTQGLQLLTVACHRLKCPRTVSSLLMTLTMNPLDRSARLSVLLPAQPGRQSCSLCLPLVILEAVLQHVAGSHAVGPEAFTGLQR